LGHQLRRHIGEVGLQLAASADGNDPTVSAAAADNCGPSVMASAGFVGAGRFDSLMRLIA